MAYLWRENESRQKSRRIGPRRIRPPADLRRGHGVDSRGPEGTRIVHRSLTQQGRLTLKGGIYPG